MTLTIYGNPISSRFFNVRRRMFDADAWTLPRAIILGMIRG